MILCIILGNARLFVSRVSMTLGNAPQHLRTFYAILLPYEYVSLFPQVLGYIIKYSVIDCHEDRPSGCDEKEVFNATSYGTNGTLTLSNLRKYTRYEIQIQVFNSKGKGNFSKTINATTDEDSKYTLEHSISTLN